MIHSPDTVSKPAFPMAVGIHDSADFIFFRDLRKRGSLLQDIGRRIVKEQDKLPVSGSLSLPEGFPQPFHFAGNQLFRVFFPLLIPAGNVAPAIQVKRTFKSIALGSHKGVILINRKIILKEEEPASVFFIQTLCLFGVPEHIVIAPEQDLPSWQPLDKSQILPALRKSLPPGMVACQDKGILRLYDFIYIFFDLPLMILPDSSESIHGLVRLKTQVQIAKCIQRHCFRSPFISFISVQFNLYLFSYISLSFISSSRYIHDAGICRLHLSDGKPGLLRWRLCLSCDTAGKSASREAEFPD